MSTGLSTEGADPENFIIVEFNPYKNNLNINWYYSWIAIEDLIESIIKTFNS